MQGTDWDARRARMVEMQIMRRGIADSRLLQALRTVPREAFVSPDIADLAHEDGPLPIGEGQTISQPYIVALMAEAAEIAPQHVVLEVGAGSGYGAAVLSRLAARVVAIERHEHLARQASACLARLGYHNVTVVHGDGSRGWPEAAPYDAIVVTAGGPSIPDPLRHQLAPGGRLVIPVGDRRGAQSLLRLTRTGATDFTKKDLGPVSFVPLIGSEAWHD